MRQIHGENKVQINKLHTAGTGATINYGITTSTNIMNIGTNIISMENRTECIEKNILLRKAQPKQWNNRINKGIDKVRRRIRKRIPRSGYDDRCIEKRTRNE